APERPRLSGKRQREPDDDGRRQGADRILRERRHAEGREARGDAPAPRLDEPGEDEREAPREGRDEERLGTNVPREGEEPRAREEGHARDEAAARAEEPRPEPRRGRDGGEGGERGHRARRRLARAADREGKPQERVEERRLVHVADTAERERRRVALAQKLARDLGVHPLARVVEGRPAEAHEDERRRGRDRQRRRGERAGRAGQVRETRNTPAPIRTIPAQRAGVTASARRSWARNATTM